LFNLYFVSPNFEFCRCLYLKLKGVNFNRSDHFTERLYFPNIDHMGTKTVIHKS